jgi:hypothetical protein
MMEMIEERQELSNDEIHARVERILHILQENISTPIIAVYKEKLHATLDIHTLRGMLEAIAPELPKEGLADEALLEQLDLSAWLSLILGRWIVFEPILKKTGRNAVQTLKDVYNGWMGESRFISLRDARHVALSAYDLLTEFGCKDAAPKVGVIRDELLELIKEQEGHTVPAPPTPDEIETLPAIHNRWLGAHEKSEPPALVASNHHETKSEAARIDHKRTKQLKPPADLLFLKLEIVEKHGTASAQTIDLKKPSLMIGRSQMADVEVTDPLVSRVHLLITGTTPINVKVTDLNSTNGTKLDGIPLKPNEAVYWDVGKPLVIGETWMILRQVP